MLYRGHVWPIPNSLWRRLATLDARCDISLVRGEIEAPRWSRVGWKYRRAWTVTIRLRKGGKEIEHSDPYLLIALRLAVDQAERYGWHAEPKGDESFDGWIAD